MTQEIKPKKTPSRYTSGTYLPDFTPLEGRYRTDANSLVALGRQAFNNGDYKGALWYFQSVLQVDPENKLAKYFEKKTRYKMDRAEVFAQKKAEAVAHTHKIKIPVPSGDTQLCGSCNGNGKCPRCMGSGMCPSCEGTGWRDLLGKECGMCGGKGACYECHEKKVCQSCHGRGEVAPKTEPVHA